MTDLTHIDCQGLAGAWTLGTAQAGFETVHRASLGKFGDDIIAANRHLIPGPWEQDSGNGSDEWEPAQASYLTGTPPCSGFSLLNNSKKENARGAESAINNCMKELAKYAGKCTGRDGLPGPEVISFESVQGAFKQGRDLMLALRGMIEEGTGQDYALSHILLSGATIGAAQMRHRYYFVAHRIPFGVDMPEQRRVCTYQDSIGDLIGLEDTWDEQAHVTTDEQGWWLREHDILDNPLYEYSPRNDYAPACISEVNSHISADNGRIEIMLGELFPYWTEGKDMSVAMRNFRDANGRFPFKTEHWWNEERDEMKGFAHPCRPARNRPGYVCTGGCVFDFIHYEECRMLSVRECSRLMGYPDSWDWRPAESVTKAGMYIGKCCPVTSGRWIATWVRRALEGNPGSALEEIGEREYLHNSTLLYKSWLKEQQREAAAVA